MAALKGAFLNYGAGLLGGLPNIVVFQFTPTQVSRTPAIAQQPRPCTSSGTSNSKEQPCQPGETISFSLRVDAREQLEQSSPVAAGSGIQPRLRAPAVL